MKTEHPKIPTWFKKLWVQALRSGQYKQTRGTLHSPRDGGFCCLGVAMDLMCPEWAQKKGFAGEGRLINLCNDSTAYIDWYLDKLIFDGTDCQSHLSYMNDNGKTFDQIANWIERNL